MEDQSKEDAKDHANMEQGLDDVYNKLKWLAEHKYDGKDFNKLLERAENMERKLKQSRNVKFEVTHRPELDDPQQYYNQRMAAIEKDDPKDPIERYQALLLDEDVMVSTETRSRTDPYTHKPIVVPLRNKKCGHVYDEAGFKGMIEARGNKRVKLDCPVQGCKNRDVKETDVEPFPDFFDASVSP